MTGGADLGRRLVLYLVPMLLSLTVHEYSHARVADLLGDDTPRRQGRLTLSPLAHYDLWGTIVIPLVSILAGGIAFIGWARPVETNPAAYTRRLSRRNGHRLVAFAGPLSNLVLAVLATVLLAVIVRLDPGAAESRGPTNAAFELGAALLTLNVGLFVFNLLPLPPLDGSRLLPASFDGYQRAVAPYSFLILLLLVNVRALRDICFFPVGIVSAGLMRLFGALLGVG